MEKRLSKILAEAGLASRRGSERLIAEGRVTVNGRTVATQGASADPDRDVIAVDGGLIPAREPKRYVLLNKPRGVLTTRSDPRGRPVVLDLLKHERARLFPVGRLDFDAEGLLLLTNDGALAQRLLHPRFGIERVYEVEVDGHVSARDLPRWERGVTLADGPATPRAARLLHGTPEATWLRLSFAEGRHREVKRFCEALGHRVLRLRRVQFGPLRLGDLAPGVTRPLSRAEIARLKAL